MDETLQNTLKPLSSTRVKTLENCSWVYWCNYHLRLPQLQNEGAKKGEICHTVFETLLKRPRRKAYFDKVVQSGSITACPAIERLVRKNIKSLKLHDTTEGFRHIDEMVLVGLQNDFYGEGGTIVAPEFKFDLVNEGPRFRIKGFMDKPFIRGNTLFIDDFKSSKKKFKGEEQDSNLQALFYSLAGKMIWPHLKPVVRFIFLQYGENPMMPVEFSDDALLGFKYYLESSQQKVDGFNEHVAKNNFAADQPSSSDSFCGKALCGFASKPGQLKKDGTPMWHCPYKFAFDYYAVVDTDDKIVRCAFTKEELIPLKMGEKIKKRHYQGCPKHQNVLDNLPTPIATPKTLPAKTQYHNVLDEF